MFWKRNLTFKQRVDRYWRWFSEVAREFHDTIKAGDCGDLAGKIGPQVEALWVEFQWVFGPGPTERGGHSFTVSGGGNSHGQFLAHQWLQAAPALDGWTFYASRQPGAIFEGMAFGVGEHKFEVLELAAALELDEEQQRVHLAAWHPEFASCDKGTREMVLFLILDEVLGEFGTDQWLGKIDIVDHKPDGVIPAGQLRDYLHDLEVGRGWRKLPPTESYSSYQLPNQGDSFVRADTIVGTTSHMRLIGDYLDGGGQLSEDPLEGSGAEYRFLAFPTSSLRQGDEANSRGELEDQIGAALGDHGCVLGGAIGVERSYIDLLLTDGKESLRRLDAAVRQTRLPQGVELFDFVSGQRRRTCS